METIYGDICLDAIEKQKRFLYGSIIKLLWLYDDNCPHLDQSIQSIINMVNGSRKFFGDEPKILSIIALLEDARETPRQFRKDILDAANLIDRLEVITNV